MLNGNQEGPHGEAHRQAHRETVESGRSGGIPCAHVLRIPARHESAREPFRRGDQRHRRTRGTTREKSQLPADGSRRAQLPRERSEQNPEQPGRRRPARQRKRRQRHHAARGGRPRTRGDARRFATLGKHGRFQRLHLQHQRLRGAPARRRSRGERALGGRRGIHDDHGPACAVQFRSALFRQRAAFAGQKVFAAIHHFRDRPGRDNEKGARQFAGSDYIPAVRQRVRLGMAGRRKRKTPFRRDRRIATAAAIRAGDEQRNRRIAANGRKRRNRKRGSNR